MPYTSRTVVQARDDDFVGRTVDLSARGLLLVAPRGTRAPRVGEPLRINFFSALRNEWIAVDGSVARSARVDGQVAWGIAFRRASGQVDAMLEGLARSQAS